MILQEGMGIFSLVYDQVRLFCANGDHRISVYKSPARKNFRILRDFILVYTTSYFTKYYVFKLC